MNGAPEPIAMPGRPKSRRHRRRIDRFFVWFSLLAAGSAVAILAVLLISITQQGVGHLNGSFLSQPPSRLASKAGIYPAMIGTLWVGCVCALVAIPLGVGTAIFLEEFKPHRPWLKRLHGFVLLNIANLAGVPSVVYGILGLTVFVQMFGFAQKGREFWSLGTPDQWFYLKVPLGRGVMAGGLTLMLVVLPVVIIATQESLRAVPRSIRQAALALGATPWQTIRRATLPAAVPGIMTGTILSMSRAIGEAAPILILGVGVYNAFTPKNLMDDFSVMPLQIYQWASRPQAEFQEVAASGILVLLAVLLAFNAVAIFIRQRFQRRLS